MTRRIDRVNVLLRQEVSRVLATELNDPRISDIVSITRIETSPDLRHARVFVSVLGSHSDKASTMKALKSAAGYIHESIKRSVSLRNVPSLDFYLDESIEEGARVLDLIRSVTPAGEAREGVG